jgi:hypothetical protein
MTLNKHCALWQLTAAREALVKGLREQLAAGVPVNANVRTAVSQWRPCATAECYHVATDRTLCNQCTKKPNGRNVANSPNSGTRGLPARSRVSSLQEGATALAAPSTTPAVADSVAAAAAAAAARAKANAGLGQLCSDSTAEAINSISIED